MKELLILVLLTLPAPMTVKEYVVDRIHCNTVYDSQGFPNFTQTIFEDWSPIHKRYVVREWKMNSTAWVKSDDHHKRWLKDLTDLCVEKEMHIQPFLSKYKGEFNPTEWAYKNRKTGYYSYSFVKDGKLVTVKSKLFIVTNTLVDPERVNRKYLEENDRVPLWK